MRKWLRVGLVIASCALMSSRLFTLDRAVAEQPTLSINDVVADEGDGGKKVFTFTVTKTGATGDTVSVNFSTTSPIGMESDFVAKRGTITFLPDETEKEVGIEVIADYVPEGQDVFDVNLYGPQGATLATYAGHGYIINDDIELTIDDLRYAEADQDSSIWFFKVTRRGANKDPVSFDFATVDGRATAPTDYGANSGSVTIPYNSYLETTEFIAVHVNGDTTVEPDETFSVNLSDPVNAKLVDGSARGTIEDDDGSAPSASTPPVRSPTPAPRSTLPPPDDPTYVGSRSNTARSSAAAANGTHDRPADRGGSSASGSQSGASPFAARSPGAKGAGRHAPSVASVRAAAPADDAKLSAHGASTILALVLGALLVAGAGTSIAILVRRRRTP